MSANLGVDARASVEANVEATERVEVIGGVKFRYAQGQIKYEGPPILFDRDKDTLKDDEGTRTTLSALRDYLKKFSAVKVRVEGHTDSRATNEYNLDLSNRRVATVRRWLVDQGTDEARLTAVGKGEEEPQVPEGDCKEGAETAPSDCEEKVWSKNRRVELHVTEGGETIEPAKPDVPDEPAVAVEPAPVVGCPFKVGVEAFVLGPNSYGGIAGAIEPACWLELNLGLGLRTRKLDAVAPNGDTGAATAFVATVPLRARAWFLRNHSPIVEAGLGLAVYRIGEEGTTPGPFRYFRTDVPVVGVFGAGYGYRSEGPFRLALLVGGVVHPTDLDPSTVYGGTAASNQDLQVLLDNLSSQQTELKPYGEVSVGLFFW